MAKTKKNKKKQKVVPSFNKVIERNPDDKVMYEWISEEMAIGRLTHPLMIFGGIGDKSPLEAIEGLQELGNLVWRYASTTDTEVRKKVYDYLITLDAEPNCPFIWAVLLPVFDEVFAATFPEGLSEPGAQLKVTTEKSTTAFEKCIPGVKPEFITPELAPLVDAVLKNQARTKK